MKKTRYRISSFLESKGAIFMIEMLMQRKATGIGDENGREIS